MEIGSDYLTADGMPVRVVAVYRKCLRKYVDFYVLHGGIRIGIKRTVTYSYAKKNWTSA